MQRPELPMDDIRKHYRTMPLLKRCKVRPTSPNSLKATGLFISTRRAAINKISTGSSSAWITPNPDIQGKSSVHLTQAQGVSGSEAKHDFGTAWIQANRHSLNPSGGRFILNLRDFLGQPVSGFERVLLFPNNPRERENSRTELDGDMKWELSSGLPVNSTLIEFSILNVKLNSKMNGSLNMIVSCDDGTWWIRQLVCIRVRS